jgi:hypothetical protein
MRHKRIYVRVPLRGDAVLSQGSRPLIKARTIDISQGGVAVTDFSEEVSGGDYQIEILTEGGGKVEILARLVRVEDAIAGFQTLRLEGESHEVISDLIFRYQETMDFVKQFDEYDLDKAIDDEGNEIEITFEDDHLH